MIVMSRFIAIAGAAAAAVGWAAGAAGAVVGAAAGAGAAGAVVGAAAGAGAGAGSSSSALHAIVNNAAIRSMASTTALILPKERICSISFVSP